MDRTSREAICQLYHREVHSRGTRRRADSRDGAHVLSVQRGDATGSTRWRDSKCGHYVVGSVGVGKTYLAQALGHSACRAGYRVLFIRTDALLKALASSRADNSFDRELRRFIAPDLIVIDDFGLRKLSGQASSDFYDLVVERHTRAATIITSNRAVDEWMAVFDEPLLGQSALDRFCHRAHQFVIDGESYRKRTAPSGKSESPKRPTDSV
jgi:DNA replication protein DnaC